ncbi:MAG: PDZ domain-containing protein [Actinobacteria bacterium]|jgi:carboxyl-terminal processing protease|nr:PDZ domain-containing protein [Actinomycetota bacterium]
MKKKQPNYSSVLIAGGVIFAAGFLFGSLLNRDSNESVLDEVTKKILANSANQTDQQTLERAAIDGMLKSLGDKWSQYLPSTGNKSFEESIEGQFSGIGVWIRSDESGAVSVAGIVPSSPAEFAKIQNGDVIESVDGVSTFNRPLSEVANLLSGESNTNAILAVKRNDELLSFNIKRIDLKTNPVRAKILNDGVISIAISEFNRGSARALRAALGSSGQEITGVILDLRGNPGGLLVEAVDVAGAFLNGGLVVEFHRSGQSPEVFNALGNGDSRTPLVVIVDRGTASAAEVVAAALQDRNRAIIVGEKTFGKATVQNSESLSNGAEIELTVGYYITPSGKKLDGQGIEPDIEVSANEEKFVAEQRALQVLSGLLASVGQRG